MSDEPAALGCASAMSPERPMPCANPKCRCETRGQMTRPSRSPTPALPGKVLESSAASSASSRRRVASSHPCSGSRRCASSVLTSDSRACRACCACRM
eukprot:scaffold2182_cov118-Isochrysis_galbana.AAC.8